MRAGRRLSLLLALVVALPIVGFIPARAASPAVVPSKDPFYRYTGARSLSTFRPGAILKQRAVRLALGPGNGTPVRADQLLYRTTGQLGEPTVTVTTVLRSLTARTLPRIVGYLSFYDGLSSQCDPSYTLTGGEAGDDAIHQQAQEEELLIFWYLAQGNVVTVPDFEGTGLHWMAGRESGYGTLDAIKATESFLGLDASTKVGLSGYSGGSVAANWAFESAPVYAPTVNLVGVAMGGVPANYFHHFAYINGNDEYSPAIAGELLGLARAYGNDLTPYLSAYGRRVVNEVGSGCIVSAFGNYPGLTLDKLLLPPYRDLAHVAPFATMLREQTMGQTPTVRSVPMLIANGNVDGVGDGAMVAADAKALARRYCLKHVPVRYQQYRNASHIVAAAFFDPQTGPWLQARFAGVPMLKTKCASLAV